MKRRELNERKRVEADQRKAEYDALSPREKYDRAVERGHRDTREAKRLWSELEASK